MTSEPTGWEEMMDEPWPEDHASDWPSMTRDWIDSSATSDASIPEPQIATASSVRLYTSGVNTLQALVKYHVDRIWPNEDDFKRTTALAEEVGEVARGFLKRAHGREYGFPVKLMNEDQWDANIRLELAQAMLVILDIAANEDINLIDELTTAIDALAEIPSFGVTA